MAVFLASLAMLVRAKLLMQKLDKEVMQEARKRSVLKSISWRIVCVVVSILTSFWLTGKWDIAVAIGTVYNVITMILYYFHERIWNRVQWGCEKPRC
jgi:uncharacterized membrane protein